MADVTEATEPTNEPSGAAVAPALPEGSAAEATSDLPKSEPQPEAPEPKSVEVPISEVADDDDEEDDVEAPWSFAPPTLLSLDQLTDDAMFLIRDEAELVDVSNLATDIARLGQLFPIDVRVVEGERLQIVTGFRRVAALNLLQRERVLARVHKELSDTDAMLMALAAAIHGRSTSGEALLAVKERLESMGRLPPAARDMLEKALATESDLAPEAVEEEVDADELAADVTARLGQCNQDLSLLADVFGDLDDTKRAELLQQLRYSIDLVAFLERKS